jgi:hypothetical protein
MTFSENRVTLLRVMRKKRAEPARSLALKKAV